MTNQTPRLGLNTFSEGEDGWDHTDTVEALDELAVETGPIANRPATGDYDDQFYYAVDQRLLWRWDTTAGDWQAAGGLGVDGTPVPGTSYLEALSVTNEIDAGAVSADEVINNAVYSTKEDLPENAEEGAQAYVSDQGELYLFEVSSPGEWVQAMPEPVRLKNDVNFLLRENVELRHELGLERLDYDNGWADGYFDTELIDSDTDLEGFDGEVSVVDTAAYGELTTTWQDFGFVPESVVIGQSVEGTESNPIAENGEQFEYEISDSETVDDVTLELTGVDSKSEENRSYSEVADSETISWSLSGMEDVDLNVSFEGVQGFDEENIDEEENSPLNEPTGQARIAWHPDSDKIAAGEALGSDQIYVWDTDTWSEIDDSPLQVGVNVFVVEWGPNGEYLAAAAENGEVYVWDADTWEQIPESPLQAGNSDVISLDWSPHGDYLTTGNEDNDVYVWDTDSWDQIPESSLQDLSGAIRSLAWSPDDSVLVAGSGNNETHIWDTDTWDEITESPLQDPSGTVHSLAWKPDANELAAGTRADEIHIWDTDTWDEITESPLQEPGGTILSLDWSPDSGYLAGGMDETDNVLIWNTDSWSEIDASPLNEPSNEVYSVGWGPDEKYLGAGTFESVHVWETVGPGTVDPSITIDGQTINHDGELDEGETISETLTDLSPDSYDEDVSLSDGAVNIELDWTETTVTRDPTVTISSDGGTQDISHDGDIADGETVDVSDSIDESLIGGVTTISLSVSDEVDGPVGKTRVNFEHNGVEWSAGGSVFEIEDGDGNTESRLPIDDIQDLNFTDEEVRLNIQYRNGFGDPLTGRDYGVYLNGGD